MLTTLDRLDMMNKICNNELLPTITRMKQTRDESSTVCMAKECDILGDKILKKISSTYDDIQVSNLEVEEEEDVATKECAELPNEQKNTQSHVD